MTPKVKQLGHLWCFHCPACNYGHNVQLDGPRAWTWNRSLDRPTIRPSVMINREKAGEYPRCHSLITNGNIQFFEDSTHALAGKSVPLPDWQD